MATDSTNEAQSASAFPIREYLAILFQRRLGFILAVIVVVCLGVAYTLHQPKIFEASNTVIINPEPPTISPLESMDATQQWYMRDTYYDTQLKVMQSRKVAQRVVNDLGLEHDIDFLGLSEIKEADKLEKALASADAVSVLLGRLKIESITNTRLVKIIVKDRNAERAASIANTLATAYSEQNAEFRLTSLNKTSDFITQQNADNQKKLEEARNAINAFQDEHDILYSNPLEQQKITNARLTSLFDKRIEVETERERLSFTLAELKKYPQTLENAQTYAAILSIDPSSLGISACRELNKEEQKLLQTYQETAPQVVSIRSQIEDCQAAILASMKSMSDGLTARFQAINKLSKELDSQIAKLQKEALELDQLRLLYEQFEAQKEEQERLFGDSQRKLNEVSLNRLLEVNNIRILDYAIPGTTPVSPNLILNALATLAAAFFFGIFFVLLLELLDITVRSQADIENRARFPFLGSVPKMHRTGLIGKDAYRFILEHPHSPVSECIRTLRTTLMFLLPDNASNILLVTSAQPYDGKTMTSLNLAVTSAIAGKKTLLIEADLRRPRLYKALNIKQDSGLSSLIQGKSKIEDSVCHTELDALDLLPCGTIPQTPAELFQSDNFPRLLDNLRSRYDFIVIDSPPVTVVSDALIISKFVNGVLVIARARKTQLPNLVRTRELLDGVQAPILGVVLNDLKSGAHGYGNGYYYTHEYK